MSCPANIMPMVGPLLTSISKQNWSAIALCFAKSITHSTPILSARSWM